jgi:uncharacterized RDD family membrane protein YckC/energy-coupling factor transporter ATP-binding protein EcfA2
MSATIITEDPRRQRLANPFPGLRPFREDEEQLFFGRERQVDTLIDKLSHTRFLAVVGTSGSGKSSLVNCGLQPGLHRGLMTSAGPVWKVAKFRPGRYPIQALAQALASAGVLAAGSEGATPVADIIETHLRVTNRGLVNVFEKSQLLPGTNLLVIADQFEEIFRFQRSVAGQREQYGYIEDVTAFVNLLLTAAASTEQIYVVLTIRSDFLGDCAQFHDLPEAINQGQFLVPRMTRDERRQAIAGPVAVAGGELDPALLSRLINDVGDNPDQLSILQHAVNRMWAHWESQGADRPISLDDYEAVGTMAHALDRHAEAVFSEVEKEGLARVCEKIFKALTDKSTDPRGIRRPMEFGELCAITDATPDQVSRVVETFREPSRSFLMPPVPEELKPAQMIDISHESLMRVWERLTEWVEEEAQSAAMYRRLSESATLHAAGKAGEWRDPELQLGLSWVELEHPVLAWAQLYGGDFSAAMSFLEKSKQSQIRELAEEKFEHIWRSRWEPAGLVVALIVAVLKFEAFAALIQHLLLQIVGSNSTVARWAARGLASSCTAMIFFGCYVAYERYGKPILRRVSIVGITKQVAEPARPAVSRSELPAIPSQYAAFGWRVLSAIVDFVIDTLMMFLACIFVAAFKLNPEASSGVFWIYFILAALHFCYQVLCLTSNWQATLGMKVAGLYVTDTCGERLSWTRAMMRDIAKLLTFYSFFIGALMPLWTKRRQTLHDKIVGSVVRRRSPKEAVADAPKGAIPAAAGTRIANAS